MVGGGIEGQDFGIDEGLHGDYLSGEGFNRGDECMVKSHRHGSQLIVTILVIGVGYASPLPKLPVVRSMPIRLAQVRPKVGDAVAMPIVEATCISTA